MHKNIMILGTASSAGKSLIATALCRVFYEDGYKVTPFKSQNMSLNSFVTEEGLEMGKAQVVQAEAAGIKPKVFMNPILLKPSSENGSQIVFMGKVQGNMDVLKYSECRANWRKKIEEIYLNIKNEFDICVIEGAGSPAEINLNKDDLVNMGMAKIAKAPCILVADIDKGGVFASIYGTIMLLPPEERKHIKGIIINKFRGEIKLLETGLKMIEELVHIPVLGVMPYFQHNIEEEDSANSESFKQVGQGEIIISVLKLPHMSNYNDIDPFKIYEFCTVKFIEKVEELEGTSILIIPGSKNTISDLLYLKNNGFFEKIYELKNASTLIIGICGGLQILGKSIEDPYLIESTQGRAKGLGLLDIETVLEREKITSQFHGEFSKNFLNMKKNQKISGYEIHQGISKGNGSFLESERGSIAFEKENVIGTYLHGIFENEIFLKKILELVIKQNSLKIEINRRNFKEYKEKEYKNLSKIFRESIKIDDIYQIMKNFNLD